MGPSPTKARVVVGVSSLVFFFLLRSLFDFSGLSLPAAIRGGGAAAWVGGAGLLLHVRRRTRVKWSGEGVPGGGRGERKGREERQNDANEEHERSRGRRHRCDVVRDAVACASIWYGAVSKRRRWWRGGEMKDAAETQEYRVARAEHRPERTCSVRTHTHTHARTKLKTEMAAEVGNPPRSLHTLTKACSHAKREKERERGGDTGRDAHTRTQDDRAVSLRADRLLRFALRRVRLLVSHESDARTA